MQDSNRENTESGSVQPAPHASISPPPRHSRHPIPTSRQLVLVALVLWLISLALPFFVSPEDADLRNVTLGYHVLLLGWLGPLLLIFSWYANPLFLFACLKLLLTKRSAGFTAGLAVVLAVSFLFYPGIPHYPSTEQVIGYGWGAYIWYSAILLAPVAARARRLEQDDRDSGSLALWRDGPGIFWLTVLVVWVGGSVSYGAYQKSIASKTERERLQQLVFKRGYICTEPDYVALASIPLTGALQVSDASKHYIYSATVPTLIEWGIPVVRKGRFDFYPSDTSPDWHLVAGPPTEAVSGIFTLDGTRDLIRARLTSADEKILAFNAKWLLVSNSNYYCPGYIPRAKENQPPRDLLLSALALPEGKFVPLLKQNELFEIGDDTEMIATRVTVIGKVQRSAITGNLGCPDDTGVRRLWQETVRPTELVFTPPASWNMAGQQPVNILKEELFDHGQVVFQVQEHFHYINAIRRDFTAICVANASYLGWGIVHGRYGSYDRLFLEKRSLPDFRKAWPRERRIEFRRPGKEANTPYMKIYLYSIEEIGNSLSITLAYFEKDAEEGDLIKVIAELNQSEQ